MRRSIHAVLLVAVLSSAIAAGSSPASAFVPAQLTNPAAQVTEAPKTVAPQPKDKSLPGEPVAFDAPVGKERTSEAVIVLLGTFLGVAGIVGFHHLGQRMRLRSKARLK